MALKFNLANQLMGPEQMGQYGQAFGEGLGGLGMAWADHLNKQNLEQEQLLKDKEAVELEGEGFRRLHSEGKLDTEGDDYKNYLMKNPDFKLDPTQWDIEVGDMDVLPEEEGIYDASAAKSSHAEFLKNNPNYVADPDNPLGVITKEDYDFDYDPEWEKDYTEQEIDFARHKAQRKYDANAPHREAANYLAAGGMDTTTYEMKDMVKPDPFTFDKKSLKKIEIPYSDTPTADDYTAYGEMYGQEALDKKLYEDNRKTEIELRQDDLGMHSGASYQGLSTGTGLGMEAGQKYALGSADQISSVSKFEPSLMDYTKTTSGKSFSESAMDNVYDKAGIGVGKFDTTDKNQYEAMSSIMKGVRSGDPAFTKHIPEGMSEEEFLENMKLKQQEYVSNLPSQDTSNPEAIGRFEQSLNPNLGLPGWNKWR